MIYGIQIAGLIFGIIMMYFTFLYYKRNNYTKNSLVLWMAVWIGVILLVMVPQMFYGVMNTLNIQRTADFLSAGAILFLTTLSFYMYSVVKKTEKRVERLVREVAIRDKDEEK